MGEKNRFLLFAVVLLVIFPFAAKPISAISGTTTLLAVAETDGGFEGRIATLNLDIKKGTGQVFISTFPFSKVDTQISTRFARDIACQYLKKDCSRLDFFYTIESPGAIIGGPSAGAATTVLTIALLEGKQLDGSISLTGTMNSGGVIGNVGGIKEKIKAASEKGIKKVLLPVGEGILEDQDFFNDYSVELAEVSDIDDVLYEFGLRKTKPGSIEINVDPHYSEVMEGLAADLCNRSGRLLEMTEEHENNWVYAENSEYLDAKTKADAFINKSERAMAGSSFYSAASYCYGANVQRSFMLYLVMEIDDYDAEVERLREFISELEERIGKAEKKTITDLESYMAVKERLSESRSYLDSFQEELDLNHLAFAKERLYSAYSWATFLTNKGKHFELDRESLKRSCESILGEAQEKYQYLALMIPDSLKLIFQEIEEAKKHYTAGEFELCMFVASKSKARSNLLLSSINVGSAHIKLLMDQKLFAAKKVIANEASKGIFPILGYSYYEYANELKEDPYSALLYAEYAIELSNLDIYFKGGRRIPFSNWSLNKDAGIAALLGFVLGIVAAAVILVRRKFTLSGGRAKPAKKSAKKELSKSGKSERIMFRRLQ